MLFQHIFVPFSYAHLTKRQNFGPEKLGLIIDDVTYHALAPPKGLNRSIARAVISTLMHIAHAWLASRFDWRAGLKGVGIARFIC